MARVLGRPKESVFTISCPIRPEPRIRPYQVVGQAEGEREGDGTVGAGKPSVTEVRVLEEGSPLALQYSTLFPAHLIGCSTSSSSSSSSSGDSLPGTSLVELRPHTGRYGMLNPRLYLGCPHTV